LPVGEYELCRLSAPMPPRRQGRVPTTRIRATREAANLHCWRPVPRRRLRRVAPRLRRHNRPVDPAICGWCISLLHAVTGWDGGILVAPDAE
jgi:hypothetical protein